MTDTTHATTPDRGATGQPVVIRPGDRHVVGAPDPSMPFPHIDYLIEQQDTAGFSLIDFHVPAGFTPPPVLHRHTNESAVIYVLEGRLVYVFDDGEEQMVEPGSAVHLPRGGWFKWANPGDQPARMLCMFSPAGFEQYFIELGEAVAAAGYNPAAMGTVVGPLRAKYGDEERI